MATKGQWIMYQLSPEQFGISAERMINSGIRYEPDPERIAHRRLLAQKSYRELLDELKWQFSTPASRTAIQRAAPHPITRLMGIPINRVIDTSSTYGGNILPRVDIEDTLYELFVKIFPAWERLRNGPANGLS